MSGSTEFTHLCLKKHRAGVRGMGASVEKQYKATTIVQRHTDRATCTTGVWSGSLKKQACELKVSKNDLPSSPMNMCRTQCDLLNQRPSGKLLTLGVPARTWFLYNQFSYHCHVFPQSIIISCWSTSSASCLFEYSSQNPFPTHWPIRMMRPRFQMSSRYSRCTPPTFHIHTCRVAKCHRYGRYICVKILEGWGKKCGRFLHNATHATHATTQNNNY